MARSIGAIVVGFVLIGVLSFGADMLMRNVIMPWAYAPDGSTQSLMVLIITMVYVAVFAIAGCYLTGRLAPNRPFRHAMILGGLGLGFNIAGTITLWHTAPPWYHILSLALVLPYAYVGGKLAEAHAAQRTEHPVAA
jgi:multisubunit Na+/H+ antiporter MnhB subunit